jgi:FkbM family methyltransferase
MHALGAPDLGLAPERTFPGQSLFAHLSPIKQLVRATGAKTILDYGSGKGLQYRPQKIVVDGKYVADGVAEYWDVDEVRCYDPGYPPHALLPVGKFDGVVCTDVLEHCPQEDLPWILDEILGYARSFVYLNVACFPARKTLPNGENAHTTVRPPEWWRDIVLERAAGHGHLAWELRASYPESGKIAEKVFRRADSQRPANSFELVSRVSIEGRKALFSTPNETTRWRVDSLYTKEPVTIEWLRSIPAGAVLVDVGANVGMYTVFAALARDARVFAFEPESENYALLNENIRLNRLGDRVLAICAGLSDRTGIERLYLSKVGAGASCHSLGAEVGFRLQPRAAAFVQGSIALRLDDLVIAGSLPTPEYIKIDVDGFEHGVIRGMEQTLRSGKVRSLIVELNPALAEHVDIRERLADLGFRWSAEQVAAAARTSGPFQGVAEHVFIR